MTDINVNFVEETLSFDIVEETLEVPAIDEAINVVQSEETLNVNQVEETISVDVGDEALTFTFSEVIHQFTADPAVINALINRRPNEDTVETYPAGEDLAANQIVKLIGEEWLIANQSDAFSDSTLLGFTKAAYTSGETAIIQTAGEMENLSWSLTPQQSIYLGSSGSITQNTPTGLNITIGYIINPTTIYIDIHRVVEGSTPEEEMNYAKRIDNVDNGDDTEYIYKGEASVGSITSDAVWRVQRIHILADGDTIVTWADGNANFDNIWDDHLTLSYS